MIRGYAKKSKKTKELIRFLNANTIPIIFHEDIDEVAANSLIENKVKAIINCKKSITGRYPSKGAMLLLKSGIVIIDDIGEKFFDTVNSGDLIEIKNQKLFVNRAKVNDVYNILSLNEVESILKESYKNVYKEMEKFIENTLEYAQKEKDIAIKTYNIPELSTKIENKHVLIVVRGCSYKEDLKTIKGYIKDFKPVLIGVDGGGDALIEFNLIPDIIIGDMDSVSDTCLKKCKEIIIHAYSDGTAPGAERVDKLGLKYKLFPFPGMSEDIAMIIAYEKKADLIVAVGTHSNLIDFLEKGRKGMASTMLTRLKVGSKLVDAKGVSKLYVDKLRLSYFLPIIISALIPILAIIKIYLPVEALLNLFQSRFGGG